MAMTYTVLNGGSIQAAINGAAAGDTIIVQAGIYYERSRPLGYSGTQSMEGVFCDNEEQWATFTCTDASAALGSATPTGSRNYQVGKINYRNLGLYAQGTYNFSDQFSVDAGIRYTWDKSWGSGRMMSVSYNAATGWNYTDADLLKCGERIQNLRAAFNRREGIKPADFNIPSRMLGEGDGNLDAGPLKGVRVPLPMLRDDYYTAMQWNETTGHVSKAKADELGMSELLAGYTE